MDLAFRWQDSIWKTQIPKQYFINEFHLIPSKFVMAKKVPLKGM